MAYLKCKMCGGDVEVSENSTVGRCLYCDSVMTIPREVDDRRAGLFNRANQLRMNCEFDQAWSVYENILGEYKEDAEAHWGVCLCKYGIEYVEEAGGRKPTCHRAQFDSILTDEDYLAALEYADPEAREVYKKEAENIDEIQQRILAVSAKESPYSVFICYKERDDVTKERTPDSVMAQDIYEELTRRGEKVFFARITLEEKLGVEFEPYIFAALNSAKVMLVVGTRPEYINAVWVKNEWSRYLALMRKNPGKQMFPVFRDMDPETLPKEFSKLQAQDMGKIGALQDLVRGIQKITGNGQKESTVSGGSEKGLVKRGMLYLEDDNFKAAFDCFERALDQNPENSQAYFGKLLCEKQKKNREALMTMEDDISDNGNFKKALQFASPEEKAQLEALSTFLKDKIRKKQEAKEAQKREVAKKRAGALMEKLEKLLEADKKACAIKNSEAAKLRNEKESMEAEYGFYVEKIGPGYNACMNSYHRAKAEQEDKIKEIWDKILKGKKTNGDPGKVKNLNLLYDQLKKQAGEYLALTRECQEKVEDWRTKLAGLEQKQQELQEKAEEAIKQAGSLDVSSYREEIFGEIFYWLCLLGNPTDPGTLQRKSKMLSSLEGSVLRKHLHYLLKASMVKADSRGYVSI